MAHRAEYKLPDEYRDKAARLIELSGTNTAAKQ